MEGHRGIGEGEKRGWGVAEGGVGYAEAEGGGAKAMVGDIRGLVWGVQRLG